MKLKEADNLFVTKSRGDALEALIDDKKVRRIALKGLKGSAPAMLFAGLKARKQPFLIVATTLMPPATSIMTCARLPGSRAWQYSQADTVAT